jgi:hypothetical protein
VKAWGHEEIYRSAEHVQTELRRERIMALASAQRDARPGHHGEVLNRLSSDYARYQYCRAMSEKYRDKYWDGKLEYVDLAREDPALRGKSREEIDMIGQQRWSRTVECKDVIDLEKMWHRWAVGFATILQMEALNGLLRGLR